MKKIKYLILHHTGAEEKNAEHVKNVHLQRGWRDVGYNYIIERDGRVVPGRPPTIPGAHCRADGMNFKSLGIAVIGNMEKREPTEAQTRSLQGLITSLREEHEIPGENILGHKEVRGAATLCPGKKFPEAEIKIQKMKKTLYRVQVGAFQNIENAKRLKNRLAESGFPAVIMRMKR